MAIADRFAVDAYPTLVVLDAKSKYIGRYRGFFPADYLKNELEKSKTMKGKRFIASKNTTASFTETGLGGSLGYNQGWLEGKVNINGTVALQLSDVNTNYSFNLGGNYTMDKRHNLGANIFFLNNKSDNINSQNFTELTGVFRYTINF